MYHYRYATKEELKPVKAELEEIIHRVQDEVRDDFTFSYYYVGSSAKNRNLVTYDPTTQTGFDFDVNIDVNDDEEDYSPKEIREILSEAFNRVVRHYGYRNCEDSTSVLTIKFMDSSNPYRIDHSCDFAIVHEGKTRQQYIRFNKKQGTYTWEFRPKGFKHLEERAEWLKQHKLWGEVQKLYLHKKNTNTNPDKHSRSLYAETINGLYNHYCTQHNKK